MKELTRDEFIRLSGFTPEDFGEWMTRREANQRAFEEKYPHIQKEYDSKWVAFFDEKLIAVSDTLDSLLGILDARGIGRDGTYVAHI